MAEDALFKYLSEINKAFGIYNFDGNCGFWYYFTGNKKE